MKKTLAIVAFGLISIGQSALALTPDEVISGLRADGYTRVEVRVGPTQMKVEAIRGLEKREVIFDRTTGAVLKTEVERVGPGENTAPGVSVRERGRDFVRVERRSPSVDDDGTPDQGPGDAQGDDNGGDRPRGASDDGPGDDNGGDRGRGDDDRDDDDRDDSGSDDSDDDDRDDSGSDDDRDDDSNDD